MRVTWYGTKGAWLGGENPLGVGEVLGVEVWVGEDVGLNVGEVTASMDTGEEAQQQATGLVVGEVLVQGEIPSFNLQLIEPLPNANAFQHYLWSPARLSRVSSWRQTRRRRRNRQTLTPCPVARAVVSRKFLPEWVALPDSAGGRIMYQVIMAILIPPIHPPPPPHKVPGQIRGRIGYFSLLNYGNNLNCFIHSCFKSCLKIQGLVKNFEKKI